MAEFDEIWRMVPHASWKQVRYFFVSYKRIDFISVELLYWYPFSALLGAFGHFSQFLVFIIQISNANLHFNCIVNLLIMKN